MNDASQPSSPLTVVTHGLPARDAAGLSLLVRRHWPSWEVTEPSAKLASEAQICVVDVQGIGLRVWDRQADAALRERIGQHPAILLVPGYETSWIRVCDELSSADTRWRVVAKPYTASTMRAALEQSAARQASARPRDAADSTLVTERAFAPTRPNADAASDSPVTVATGIVDSLLPREAHGAPGEADPLLEIGDDELSLDTFIAAIPTSPHAACREFLTRLAEPMAAGRAIAVDLTLINGLVLNPQEHWAASSTPLVVLRRMCHSRSLASVVRLHTLPTEGALRHAQRINMAMYPLGTFLHALSEMAECTLPGKPPAAGSAPHTEG